MCVDATFQKQSATAFPFTDPNLPQNYAPFGIQAIANGPNGTTQIYVSYAMSGTGANKGTCEDTRGAGFGMVNVFDANGKLVTELVKVGGLLNAPWGNGTGAPKDFGSLSWWPCSSAITPMARSTAMTRPREHS